MAEQDNVQIIKEAYAAFGRGDIPSLLNMLSEDVDWHIPGNEQIVPYAGKYQGREGVGNFFSNLGGAEETTRFEPQEFIAQGDKVVATGNYGAHVRTTGNDYGFEFVHIFTVSDGRITNFRQYADTADCIAAYTGAAAATA
jgi:uncharacterized protein